MPPRKHGPPPHASRKPVPSSVVSRAIDEDTFHALLEPVIPAREDRDFVVRCLAREGPVHHRAASYALIRLLARVAERTGAQLEASPEGTLVPMRLPPHAARKGDDDDGTFPLRLPDSVTRRLSDDEKVQAALADALVDGPPHHALANVVMASLLDAILDRLGPGD